jgi:ribosomal protein S5
MNNPRVKSTILSIKMVSHTRARGRVSSYQVVAIAGNRQGYIGYAVFSGSNIRTAKEHAQKLAGDRMVYVERDEHGCLPFDFVLRKRGLKILFRRYKTRDKIVANPKIFTLLELCGIKSGMVKFYGRFNLIKTLKYMIERMSGMPSKH